MGIVHFHAFVVIVALACAGAAPNAAYAAEKDAVAKTAAGYEPKAFVISVSGSGVARVRHKSGIESVLGAKAVLKVGDKITTDNASVVQLSLPDGSLVRVGFNTEYRIDEAKVQDGMIAWVFNLTRGTIRAMVEKSGPKKESKFRVNTPAGTMGVRGTELIVEHSIENDTSTLYTLEGKVGFGAPDCEKKKNCILVTTGHKASIKKGQRPGEILPFTVNEITSTALRTLKEGEKAKATTAGADAQGKAKAESDAELLAKLSVLQELKNLGKVASAMDDAELRKLAGASSHQLADLQDMLLGRSAEIRKAMETAAANGTFDDMLKLGEKVKADAGDKTTAGDLADLSGAANTRKFEAASAAVNASAAKDKANVQANAAAGLGDNSGTAGKTLGGSGSGDSASPITAQSIISTINQKQASYSSQLAQQAATLSGSTKSAAAMMNQAGNLSANAQAVKNSTATNTSTSTVATEANVNTAVAAGSVSQQTEAATKPDEPYVPPPTSERIGYNYPSCYEQAEATGLLYTYCPLADGSTLTIKVRNKSRSYAHCYDYRRDCKSAVVPCDLSSGKACKATVKTTCKDVQVEIGCQ